jgi:hypothetical protein
MSVLKSSLKPALKPLAVTLALIGDDKGERIFPSVTLMAWLLGKDERTIQIHLRELRALEVLVPTSPMRRNKAGQLEPKGGSGKTVHYRLVVPNERPPFRPPGGPGNGETDFTVSLGEKGEASFTVPRSKRVKVSAQTVKPISPNGEAHFTRSVSDTLVDPLVRTRARVDRNGFDAFWDAYPKKENEDQAWRVWQTLAPNTGLLATMIAALDWQTTQPKWQREGGRFIPMPAKWLRDRRWTDQPPTTPVVSERTAMLDRAMKGFLSHE